MRKEVDYIKYIDTDSLFISIEEFLFNQGIDEDWWNSLGDDRKINIIIKLSKIIEDFVNDRVYRNTQRKDYNSAITDFRINFKQEIVAKSSLFIKKKKYAYWCINEEGADVDKLNVTGLDVVRSDSSEAIRTRLKSVMQMILKKASEEEITNKIIQYKKELKKVYPEEIAASIGVRNIDKYIKDGKAIKGTPWHVKGVANYRFLLKELNIQNEYENIYDGVKTKVVYLRKNKFNMDTVTFLRWPKEFDKELQVDYNTMIEKFFVKKIKFLLSPMGKEHIVHGDSNVSLKLFFG
jgi:DNA polymerase elongation subunit (family B)